MQHEYEDIITEARNQFEEILRESKQAICLYLDDTHKVCDRKFASMLGNESADEWAHVEEPFTDALVKEQSQHALVSAYQETMESKTGSSIDITWKTKTGGNINTDFILVPVSAKEEPLALHVITKV